MQYESAVFGFPSIFLDSHYFIVALVVAHGCKVMGALSSIQLNSVLWCLIFLVLSMAPRILRWLLDIWRIYVSLW